MSNNIIYESEFPMWVQVIDYTIFAVFIIWMIRGVWVNYLSVIFARRKVVKARLISKVEEPYKETRAYQRKSASVANHELSGAFAKRGMAYRLYFDIDGKTKELDVDKDTYIAVEEGTEGMLDYKGSMLYSFAADKK